ncbi:MAG: DNA-3-methyladenine glycosylase family protein, partial [Chitinophagaceae bacterium]
MLEKDPILGPLLLQHAISLPTPKQNLIHYLCSSILSQQLSTKVAAVILQRFLQLYGGSPPRPQQILDTHPEQLRSIGLSNAKTGYVQNVARFALEHQLTDEQLYSLSDEEIIQLLTQIKGVGRWTVEMMLLFGMGRPDVFAPDDLGIQLSMIKLYGLDSSHKKQLVATLQSIAEPWKPERSKACLL